MRRVVNGITTAYTLELNAGLTQVLADGTNTYLYGNGWIAQYAGATLAYFLGDALGSMRQLANASGAVALAQSYQQYGSVMNSQSPHPRKLDWIVFVALLMAIPCEGLLSIIWGWTGYDVWYWLRDLVIAIPAFFCGMLSLTRPRVIFDWYLRLNNYIGQLVKIRDIKIIRMIRPEDSIVGTERAFIVGLCLTIFGALEIAATIIDIISRPECLFLMRCSFIER